MPDLDVRLERVPASLIYLLLAGLSVLALVPVWINYDIISMDGAFQYIPYARVLLEGDFAGALQLKQLPLYPGLIALTVFLTDASFELAGRLVSAACFVLLVLGMWQLTLVIFKRRPVALCAVLLTICIPELLDRAVDCLKEALLLALLVWGNVLVLAARGKIGLARHFRIGGGILLMLLAVFVRTTAIFFIGAWAFVWLLQDANLRLKRLAAILIPLLLTVVLACIFRESAIFQRKGFAIFYVLELFPGWAAGLSGLLSAMVKFLLVGNPLVMAFAFAGVAMMTERIYRLHVLGVLTLFAGVIFMLGWSSDRYLLAPVIWLLPAGAWALVKAWASGRHWRRLAAVIVLISCSILWGVQSFKLPDQDKLAQKTAGLWIRDLAGPGQAIFSNVPRLVFYADGRLLLAEEVGDMHGQLVALDIKHPGADELRTALTGRNENARFGDIVIYLPAEIEKETRDGN